MTTTTAAGSRRSAAVVVHPGPPLLPRLLLGSVLSAPVLIGVPAHAHPEGLQPYRYVVAPPGVDSEGPPERSSSVQPIGDAGFAGTTDNQMQLTLPPGALPARAGEQGVRVQLDQLDPATLPPLPAGLEPEGNAYRLSLTYARSGSPVPRLTGATLSLTAPAAPTGMLELVVGRWQSVEAKIVVGDEGVSSVVDVARPGTLLQVYDPTTAFGASGSPTAALTPLPSPTTAITAPAGADRRGTSILALAAGIVVGAVAVLGTVGLCVARRRQVPE